MSAIDQNAVNDNSFPGIRKIALIAFLGAWLLLAVLLSYLHWLNAFYAAIILTPILTAFIIRARECWQRGLTFLPKRRAARLYGWSFVTWFSLMALLYSIELWRGKWSYASLLRSVEESNRSLNVESLAPPMVNEQENFCATPLLASLIKGNEDANLILSNYRDLSPSEELDRIRSVKLPDRKPRLKTPWFVNRSTNFDFWVRLFERHSEKETQTHTEETTPEQILAYLEPYTELINELLEAARSHPSSRWDLSYERGYMVEALVAVRDDVIDDLVRLLALRSSTYLVLGQNDAAANDLYLGMRLVETVRNEPSIHTQLRRIEWLFILFQPLWEGLATQTWNEIQLNQIRSDLEKIDLMAEATRLRTSTAVLHMDLWNEINDAYSIRSLIRNHRALLSRDGGARFWVGLLWQFHPKGWTYQNQVLTYRWFFPPPNTKTTPPTDPINAVFILPKLISLSRELEEHFPRKHVTIQQAIIACALEQFRMEHGTYPEELSELALNRPTSIKEPDGQPRALVNYHRLPGGRYLLAPPTVQHPSATFEPENNPDLIPFTNNVWDQVWRYPTDL